MLLLSDRQMGGAWEPSNKEIVFGIREYWEEKCFYFFKTAVLQRQLAVRGSVRGARHLLPPLPRSERLSTCNTQLLVSHSFLSVHMPINP